ncbi:hypothetical protein ACU4GD_09440 [Cupriavidus basilensis]
MLAVWLYLSGAAAACGYAIGATMGWLPQQHTACRGLSRRSAGAGIGGNRHQPAPARQSGSTPARIARVSGRFRRITTIVPWSTGSRTSCSRPMPMPHSIS